MLFNFFDKESASLADKSASGKGIFLTKHWQQNCKKQLSNNSRKKLHSSFIDNTWGADLADMHLINKFNKRFRFLLCVIGIFSKYAWVIPLKDRDIVFQKILEKSNCKPNEIWVDKGSEFYNRSMKSWLEKNAIEVNSTHNKTHNKICCCWKIH